MFEHPMHTEHNSYDAATFKTNRRKILLSQHLTQDLTDDGWPEKYDFANSNFKTIFGKGSFQFFVAERFGNEAIWRLRKTKTLGEFLKTAKSIGMAWDDIRYVIRYRHIGTESELRELWNELLA